MADISYNESLPVEGGPAVFEGLWLHFPGNEQLSSHNFRYGKDTRSYATDVGGSEMEFAGRKYPVVEFGEHQNESFKVTVLIPHGPDYYTERDALRVFGESKTTVVARDNRGHVVFGVIQSFEEGHESEGSSFSFDVLRVHQEETEIL